MCIFLCFFSIFLVVCLRACFLLPKRRKKMHRPIKVQEGHLFGRRDTHDFVRNSEVSLRTGLAPASGRITRGRNAIFGHVARLPDNVPAHQAMLRQVELSVGRPQTLHGNVHQVDHVPNGPTNSTAITTMFPLRLYGPSRLRVNDDDGGGGQMS